MELYIIFILGLLIGSFLNVCIYRIPRGESISFPPSHCTNCGTRLKPYDLVPVLSYFFLGGRCRSCGEKISIVYPLIELLNGVLYVLIYVKFGMTIQLIKFAIFASIMIVIAMIDYYTTDIYFNISAIATAIGAGFLVYNYYNNYEVLTYIYGMLLGGLFIGLIILISKGGMGWGDVEICAICGLYLGIKLTVLMLFLSFLIGGIAGLTLILCKKKTKKDYVAFGPFMAIAGGISLFIGEKLINTYIKFFFL